MLLVALALAFAPASTAGFILIDDQQNILANPSFRGLDPDHLGWMFSTSHMGHYQPITWLTYAADYAVAGLDPLAYHATSLLLHAATAVAFFLLARLALSSSEVRHCSSVDFASLTAALTFAVHPLRAESVAWVTGRNDLTSGLFFVLAMLAWLAWARRRVADVPIGSLRSTATLLLGLGSAWMLLTGLDFSDRERLATTSEGRVGAGCVLLLGSSLVAAVGTKKAGYLAISLVTFAASLAGKASAVTTPLVLLVLDVWPLKRWSGWESPDRAFRALSIVAEKTPFFVLAVVFGRIAFWAKHGHAMYSLAEHTPFERLLQAGYGIVFYPWKTLAPLGLVPIYDLPAHISLSDLPYIFTGVLALAITAVAWIVRRSLPGVWVTWLSYLILIAPLLGLFQSGPQLVADRYSYLACMPFAVLLGGAAYRLEQTRGGRWLRVGGVPLAVVLIALTWMQTVRWRSSESLFSYSAVVNGSPRILTNWAMDRNAAAESDPVRRQAYLKSALALSDRALATALERDVYVPTYRLHRGTILYNLGRYEEAIEELARYCAEMPEDPQGPFNLGLALNASRRWDEAAEALKRALSFKPDWGPCWRNLGFALDGMGRLEEAVAAYRRSLELDPNPVAQARLRALAGK